MTNEEKANEIARNDKLYGDTDNKSKIDECYTAALEMAKWKDSISLEYLNHAIEMCNKYIESHPKNLLMIKFYLGQIFILDKLLGTDSKDKINMAFATLD